MHVISGHLIPRILPPGPQCKFPACPPQRPGLLGKAAYLLHNRERPCNERLTGDDSGNSGQDYLQARRTSRRTM
jgi:hypothetical protein